jgi:hypothetical protein
MTLVTLNCTHVDIAMSVSAAGGAVYSPPVLRLRGHVPRVSSVATPLTSRRRPPSVT